MWDYRHVGELKSLGTSFGLWLDIDDIYKPVVVDFWVYWAFGGEGLALLSLGNITLNIPMLMAFSDGRPLWLTGGCIPG